MANKTITESVKLYLNHPRLEEGKDFVELIYYPTSHAYKVDGTKLLGVSSVPDVIDKPGLRFYYMNEAFKFIRRRLFKNPEAAFCDPHLDVESWADLVKESSSAHTSKSDRGKENGTRIHEWLEQFCIAKRDGLPTPGFPKRMPIIEDSKITTYEQEDENTVNLELNHLIDALEEFVGWWSQHDIKVIALEKIVYSMRYQYAGRFDAILRVDGKLYLVDFKTNNPSWEFPKGIFPEMFCQIGGYDVAYTEEFYPELDESNESCFDGHAVFNFNKQSGRFYKEFSEDVRVNRGWFLHTLGTKRGQQHQTRKLSTKYKENK